MRDGTHLPSGAEAHMVMEKSSNGGRVSVNKGQQKICGKIVKMYVLK